MVTCDGQREEARVFNGDKNKVKYKSKDELKEIIDLYILRGGENGEGVKEVIEKFVRKLRDDIKEQIADTILYSEFERFQINEKLKCLKDEELLAMYLNSHRYYLEFTSYILELLKNDIPKPNPNALSGINKNKEW